MDRSRYIVFISIFILFGLIYIIKLFTIQVSDQQYKTAAINNFLKQEIIYPYRGVMYDRNGKLIVQNDPIFDVKIVPKDLSIKDTNLLLSIFNITKEELKERINKAKKYSYRKPSVFQKQLSNIELAKIQTKLHFFNGFSIEERTVRSYPHTSLAHVLGYVGEINQKQLDKFAKDTTTQKRQKYRQGDYIGISGLESTYEQYLKGERGVRNYMVDVRGVDQGPFKDGLYDTASVPGNDIVTTIDIDLQQYGEFLMQGKKGSIVVIEPKTGEILSFVSAPSYDPNLLTGRAFGEHFMTLNQDTGKVLFNRPIMADQYPPGSIFKLLQSLIALEEGVITPETRFKCNRRIINCHGPHNNEKLEGAIQHSCNPYFWNTFKRIINQKKSTNRYKDSEIGLKIWKDYLISFGLDNPLGVDIPEEKSGQIPGVDLYDKMYGAGRWKFSTIYSLAIGQGEIGISPIQMANFVSIIANKGYYYTPHLVKKIGDKQALKKYKTKHHTKIDPKHFDVVIAGMERVINGGGGQMGTGFRAKLDSVTVCGKTGTSQNPHGEDHSVFIAYAPKENPQIAVSVYVENAGQGARAASSIAGLMIEKYLYGGPQNKRRQWIEDYVIKNHFIY